MLKMVVSLHIAGGSVALLSMFIPMIARKGGPTHRRGGWVFVAGMATVSITALVLAAARYSLDPRPEAKAFALFLFYIGILAGEGVWSGIRALRPKNRTAHRACAWDLAFASLLVITALSMAAYGIASGRVLFSAFSVLGIINGVQGLIYWLRTPADGMHWWFRHLSSMLGSCIAAITAFMVVNAAQVGLTQTSLVIWFTPGIVGAIAITLWTIYYKRRFAKAHAQSPTGLTVHMVADGAAAPKPTVGISL
jgi:uncharacterized membrane protein